MFHQLLQDTCEKYNGFTASLAAAHGDDKTRIEEERARHHEEAETAYKQKETDREFAMKEKELSLHRLTPRKFSHAQCYRQELSTIRDNLQCTI